MNMTLLNYDAVIPIIVYFYGQCLFFAFTLSDRCAVTKLLGTIKNRITFAGLATG